MIRTTLIALAIAATAATAIANTEAPSLRVKNIFATAKPLVIQQCAVEDCSDTPTS